ncbi:MAG: tetratricopeptide repeat protein [Novosphingobium sp.]
MALLLSLLPLLLAQIGPYAQSGPMNAPKVPQVEGRDVPRRKSAPPPVLPPPLVTGKGQACQDLVNTDAAEAEIFARDWIVVAKGAELADAQYCLGIAASHREDWAAAEAAFLAARDAVAAGEHRQRAQLGAAAGIAADSAGARDRALSEFASAHADALAVPDPALAGTIALDRASPLFALGRTAEAATALYEARAWLPDNSDAWLLSARLARRQKQLADAQSYIERAATLNPHDPAIGLEAGVIAELSGRETAARKSWQSVIASAPLSAEAQTAKGYLAQIGAGAAGTPNATTAPAPSVAPSGR